MSMDIHLSFEPTDAGYLRQERMLYFDAAPGQTVYIKLPEHERPTKLFKVSDALREALAAMLAAEESVPA